MGDPKAAEADGKSRLEEIKYYTSMFLGALCIVCVFAFLFLVPFVLDPAISTLMHQFVEKPVHCRVSAITYLRELCSIRQYYKYSYVAVRILRTSLW